MKAKHLAKILLQNPEAEVVIDDYIGFNTINDIKSATLYQKGSVLENPKSSVTGSVSKTGKCNVDVIRLSTLK